MFYIDDVDCISPRIFKFDPSTAVCSKQRKPGNYKSFQNKSVANLFICLVKGISNL